jgi:hypothetical protein
LETPILFDRRLCMTTRSPKATSASDDDMRPEYDFSGGVRGKYARALRGQGYTIRVYEADGSYTETRVLGEKTVVLEPDVWEYFPNSQAVNEALRALIAIVPGKQKATLREGQATYQAAPKKKRRPRA